MSEKLDNVDEVLFRQIHPNFKDGDGLSSQPFIPSSQAFNPTPKDNNKLSVDRSSLTDAASSYELFISAGHKSAAVFGVSMSEFSHEGIDCFSDPIPVSDNNNGNPAHALADYSPHTQGQQKNKAKRLKAKAIARGQLFPK